MKTLFGFQSKELIIVGLTAMFSVNALLIGAGIMGEKQADKVYNTTPAQKQVQKEKIENIESSRYTKLTDYLVKQGLTKERAHLILDTIEDTDTKLDVSLILGVMEHETHFKNVKAPDPSEDSVGYVQMKSDTRKWLKSMYPNLPEVKDQAEFMRSPEAQVRYMVAYLEYAYDKFDGNVAEMISSYNMGINADKLNHYYVGKVAAYKSNIDKL